MFIRCHIHANSFETTRITTIGIKTGIHVENFSANIVDRHVTSLEVVSCIFWSYWGRKCWNITFLYRRWRIEYFFRKRLSNIIRESISKVKILQNSLIFLFTVEYDDSDYDMRYEYRDRERELYELERDRERELERERYTLWISIIFPFSCLKSISCAKFNFQVNCKNKKNRHLKIDSVYLMWIFLNLTFFFDSVISYFVKKKTLDVVIFEYLFLFFLFLFYPDVWCFSFASILAFLCVVMQIKKNFKKISNYYIFLTTCYASFLLCQ